MFAEETEAAFGPWNPGIESTLPRDYLPLSTMFRPENVSTSVAEAHELADFTGLAPHDLVAFRPERLAVHELLIRVMADLNVPDGRDYGDLGINFRDITGTILSRYIEPRMAEITRLHAAARDQAARLIEDELAATIFAPSASAPAPPRRRGLFAGRRRGARPAKSVEERELQTVADWRHKAGTAEDRLHRSVYDALIAVVTAIKGKRGRVLGDRALLVSLGADMVGNTLGSEVVGEWIAPLIEQAVSQEFST